eukprot:1216902-Pyramimonas_sp.AAC.1
MEDQKKMMTPSTCRLSYAYLLDPPLTISSSGSILTSRSTPPPPPVAIGLPAAAFWQSSTSVWISSIISLMSGFQVMVKSGNAVVPTWWPTR